MDIIAISDLHGHRIADEMNCDILLIAGDIIPASRVMHGDFSRQAGWLNGKFRRWLEKQKAKHCVAIAGNHDHIFERHPDLVPSDLPWTYLQDSSCEIDGIKIYGSPWTPWFNNWAFNLDEDDPNETKLRRCFDQIPDDIDVLMTHGPPFGILDQVGGVGDHLGSVALRERVFEVKPNLHVFGHIHQGMNIINLTNPNPKVMKTDGITFANVSLLDENYNRFYKPFGMKL
jgi:Icc-related predicted phosphoesterase